MVNYLVLSAVGNDNAHSNDHTIIFTIEDTKLHVSSCIFINKSQSKINKTS